MLIPDFMGEESEDEAVEEMDQEIITTGHKILTGEVLTEDQGITVTKKCALQVVLVEEEEGVALMEVNNYAFKILGFLN